jgi:hypothetical protein
MHVTLPTSLPTTANTWLDYYTFSVMKTNMKGAHVLATPLKRRSDAGFKREGGSGALQSVSCIRKRKPVVILG